MGAPGCVADVAHHICPPGADQRRRDQTQISGDELHGRLRDALEVTLLWKNKQAQHGVHELGDFKRWRCSAFSGKATDGLEIRLGSSRRLVCVRALAPRSGRHWLVAKRLVRSAPHFSEGWNA